MNKVRHKIDKLQGIIGVINTPFTDDDKIDTESLLRYVNHSINCGVVGFLVPAMAAEVGKLTFDERREIVETVIDKVEGKVAVIGGASAQDGIERIKHVEMLTRIGCDGILVSIPFTNENNFRTEVENVAECVEGFLMIQDWDFDGFGIPVDVIMRLFAEIDVFKSLKVEVKPAGVKYSKILEASEGALHVAGGWAGTQMIEALDRGVNSFMPTILHDVYNKIFQLHQDGKRDDAIDLFNKLLPIISFSHQHVDISIHFNKRLVYKQGLFSTPNVREPILPFDQYHIKVADELIDEAFLLCSSLDNY